LTAIFSTSRPFAGAVDGDEDLLLGSMATEVRNAANTRDYQRGHALFAALKKANVSCRITHQKTSLQAIMEVGPDDPVIEGMNRPRLCPSSVASVLLF
jgi:hypothetical protein